MSSFQNGTKFHICNIFYQINCVLTVTYVAKVWVRGWCGLAGVGIVWQQETGRVPALQISTFSSAQVSANMNRILPHSSCLVLFQ